MSELMTTDSKLGIAPCRNFRIEGELESCPRYDIPSVHPAPRAVSISPLRQVVFGELCFLESYVALEITLPFAFPVQSSHSGAEVSTLFP